jgi:hypothetical protein
VHRPHATETRTALDDLCSDLCRGDVALRNVVIGSLLSEACLICEIGLITDLIDAQLETSCNDDAVHGDEEDENSDTEDHQGHDVTSSRFEATSVALAVMIRVPREWIDGTHSPTKIPADSSSSTKYRYTENRNEKKPATRNGSLARSVGGMLAMKDFTGGLSKTWNSG